MGSHARVPSESEGEGEGEGERSAAGVVWRVSKVLLLAALVPLVPFAIIGELPGDRYLLARGGDALWFGLAGAGLLALDVLLPIPSSIVATLLGARLGLGWGFACALLGLCAGHTLGYCIGVLVPARASQTELPAISTFPLVPVLAEAVAIGAGALRVPFARFALPMMLGDALYAGVMAANGAALLPDDLVGPGLIAPLALPVIGWLGFQLFRRRRRA
jgi:3-dehydroquinate synthase